MAMNFKEIMLTLLVSVGSLFVLNAIGILDAILGWIRAWIPFNMNIPGTTIGGYALTFPPVAGLIAVVIIAFLATLVGFALTEAFQSKKMWGTYVILAVVSAAIFVIVPQILPSGLMQAAAGSAQSLFTNVAPQNLIPFP